MVEKIRTYGGRRIDGGQNVLYDVGPNVTVLDFSLRSNDVALSYNDGVGLSSNNIFTNIVTPLTRHWVSSEESFFFFKLITFTLAYSYNVKHLPCIILCSSGIQNINTSSIYGNVQHLQYLHWVTKFHIQNRTKGLPVGTY